MNIYRELQKIAHNDLLEMSDRLFASGPLYKPETPTVDAFDQAPLSMIIGEHPSEYSVSPLMWNAENFLTGKPDLFLPFDIPLSRRDDLARLLDYTFAVGKRHFRVLVVTNPYKVESFRHFHALHAIYPERIVITDGVANIGAVNMILIDQDDVFHLVNSDGQGMGNAVENFLGGSLAGRRVCILGAGGAARAVLYEIARRVSAGPGGSVVLFNRTFEKGQKLIEEFAPYFPELHLSAEKMENLKAFYEQDALLCDRQDVLITSITSGDPLLDYRIYETFKPGVLIVDANYGDNFVLSRNAAYAGRNDLNIHDGRGMVIEGYVIPSKMEAEFWKREISGEVYQKIAALFGYSLL